MSKPWVWLAVCAGLLGVSDAFAAVQTGLIEFSGRIAMVDARNRVIGVAESRPASAASAPQQEFRIDTQTTISDGQRQLTLDHLLPGQEVVVQYAPSDANQPVAQSVVVKQPAPSASRSPSAPGPAAQTLESTPATP